MKALTVYQPWAQLLVLGEKVFETRAWQTAHRGWMAIHAGRKFTEEMKNLCCVDPFYSALKRHGIEKPKDLALGALVGFVKLVDVVQTEELHNTDGSFRHESKEEMFGDFRPGRFGWAMGTPVKLVKPIPYQGKLGMFEVPNDVFPAEALAQLESLNGPAKAA